MSMEQFNVESGKLVDRNQRMSSFVCGIATSQSSIEAFNSLTKKMFSYSCLLYGMDTGFGRNTSTKHSESIMLGMTFLGFSTYTEFQFDQRSYYLTDVSKTMIFYICCISFLYKNIDRRWEDFIY